MYPGKSNEKGLYLISQWHMSEKKTAVGGKKKLNFKWVLESVRYTKEGIEATMRMKFPYRFTEIMWKYVGFPTIHKVEIFKKTSFKYKVKTW